VPGTRRTDLTAERGHRRLIDRREAERHGPGKVPQFAPEKRRGEQDVDVAAAARRHVGEHLAVARGHELGDRISLSADLGGVTTTLMVVPDGSTPSFSITA